MSCVRSPRSLEPAPAPRAGLARWIGAAPSGLLAPLLPLCAIVLGFTLTADAESYPEIDVDAAGPQSSLPAKGGYYLKGPAAKDADRIQAIVVRKGTRFIIGGPGPACYRMRDELEGVFVDPLRPGIKSVRGLFSEVNSMRAKNAKSPLPQMPLDDDDVLVTEAWTAPSPPKPAAGDAGDAGATQASGGINAAIHIVVSGDSASVSAATTDGGAADGGAADGGKAGGNTASAAATSGSSDAATKPATFKLFVPSSDEFFLPGSSYCLLLFQHKTTTVDSSIADLVGARFDAEKGCVGAGAAACFANTKKDFAKGVRDRVRKLQALATSNEHRQALEKAKAKVAGADICPQLAGGAPVASAAATAAALAAWNTLHQGAAPLPWSIADRAGATIADDCSALAACRARPLPLPRCALGHDAEQRFAGVVADVAEEEALVDKAETDYATRTDPYHAIDVDVADLKAVLDHWTSNATVTDPVNLAAASEQAALLALVRMNDRLNARPVEAAVQVDILDRAHVLVTRAAPAGPAKTPVKTPGDVLETDKLPVPNSAITFRDLLELVHGRIRVDGAAFASAEEVSRSLEPAMESRAAFTPEQRSAVRRLRDRLKALDAVGRRLLTSAGPPAPVGSELEIEKLLGLWLAPALLPCPALGLGLSCVAPALSPYWPGYPGLNSPLTIAASALARLENDHDELVKQSTSGTTAITAKISFTAPVSAPLGQDRQFTQGTWAGSYLTPVVGAAAVYPNGSTPIVAPYAGVQLHVFPNPIDDPLWVHGVTDVGRAFALELGLLASAGPFGTDGRFRGPGGIFAPVLFGASIHLIPYTSFTGGVALFDVRSSTVAAQQYQVVEARFFAVNVQANLPDAIRYVVKGGAASISLANGGKSQ